MSETQPNRVYIASLACPVSIRTNFIHLKHPHYTTVLGVNNSYPMSNFQTCAPFLPEYDVQCLIVVKGLLNLKPSAARQLLRQFQNGFLRSCDLSGLLLGDIIQAIVSP